MHVCVHTHSQFSYILVAEFLKCLRTPNSIGILGYICQYVSGVKDQNHAISYSLKDLLLKPIHRKGLDSSAVKDVEVVS